jgi:hypothetical protein
MRACFGVGGGQPSDGCVDGAQRGKDTGRDASGKPVLGGNALVSIGKHWTGCLTIGQHWAEDFTGLVSICPSLESPLCNSKDATRSSTPQLSARLEPVHGAPRSSQHILHTVLQTRRSISCTCCYTLVTAHPAHVVTHSSQHILRMFHTRRAALCMRFHILQTRACKSLPI